MATRYEIRTFQDVLKAVLETLKVQASDTESVNRIKRNINMVYLNHIVSASNSWSWLNKTATVYVDPHFNAGKAAIQQNLTKVILTQAPNNSYAGYFFSPENTNEIHRIERHEPGSRFLYLETPYNGPTSMAVKYKIWTDRALLPADCIKIREVVTNNTAAPLEMVSLNQLRKHEMAGGALIGVPTFCAEGGLEEVSPYFTIQGLPSITSIKSQGLKRTITFTSVITSKITVGDRLHVTHDTQYAYSGDIIVTEVSDFSFSYTGKAPFNESVNTNVVGVSVQGVDTSKKGSLFSLMVYPAIQDNNQRVNLIVDYQAMPAELVQDRDEPAIPREHRNILFFGAMWLSSDRETDTERSAMYKGLMEQELQRMLTRNSIIPRLPTMRVSNSYLKSKGGLNGSGLLSSPLPLRGTINAVDNPPTLSGTPITIAIHDDDGTVIGSSIITIETLSSLIGTHANLKVSAPASATTILEENSVATTATAEVQYVIKRGSSYRSGIFIYLVSGLEARWVDIPTLEVGVTGVTFEADVFAGNGRFKAIVDGSGSGAVISYKASLM